MAELRANQIRTAIASSSKNAQLVIERLQIGSLIDAIIDGNTVRRSKPAPDLFLAAAAKLAVPPDECVVVEDAAAGIEAGIAAGMVTLGIGPVERVGAATLVLPDLKGVHARMVMELLESHSRPTHCPPPEGSLSRRC